MHLFLIVANALVISMLVIPAMLQVAPRLGMVDSPNLPRKVHSEPIARVGGWGIVLGALLPVVAWCPATPLVQAFVAGALVLLVAGAIDDALNINHYYKLAAQVVAVLPLVYYADLYVTMLPFIDAPLPSWLARPFTVFALVGVINALNHSDGLDGLAGGVALLSVLAIALLAWLFLAEPGATAAGSVAVAQILLIVSAAVTGGVLGFLRFNAHPARVFMGDTGSQFLGYTVGFLTVVVTQLVDTDLSPAVPALLLGLPVVDILAVVYLRYRAGVHLLMGSRNHIHHRLLDRGFSHYESVVIIYLLQAALVGSGVLLCESSDWAILAAYSLVVALLFSTLTASERRGFAVRGRHEAASLDVFVRGSGSGRDGLLSVLPLRFIALAVPAYMLVASLFVASVPLDFGIVSVLLAAVLLFGLLYRDTGGALLTRVVVYVSAVFAVYLVFVDRGQDFVLLSPLVDGVFFIVLALAMGLALRFGHATNFVPTPTDYLVAVVVLGVGVLSVSHGDAETVGALVVKCIVMLYACELLMVRSRSRLNSLSALAAVMLCCTAARGLLAG